MIFNVDHYKERTLEDPALRGVLWAFFSFSSSSKAASAAAVARAEFKCFTRNQHKTISKCILYFFLNLSFSKSCLQEPPFQILFSLTRDTCTSQLNSKFYQLPLYLCLWQLPRTGRLMSCDISSFHHCSGSEMIK